MKKYILLLLAVLFISTTTSFALPSPDKIIPAKASEQAVKNLLDTFKKAFKEEDIDLLDSIISKKISDRETLITSFGNNLDRFNFISAILNKKKITFDKDIIKVSARLTKTAEDVANVLNETQTHDFSFRINKKTDKDGIIEFQIASCKEGKNTIVIRNDAISKDDKDFEIRVCSSNSNGSSNILSAEVKFQGSKEWTKLEDSTEDENIYYFINDSLILNGLKGSFKVPSKPGTYYSKVRVKTTDGKTTILKHIFKVSQGKIESVDTGYSDISFMASTKDKNGVLWFGGSNGGKVFRSTDGETLEEAFDLAGCLPEKTLPDDTWIKDMTVDSLNRVHLIFYGRETDEKEILTRIVAGDAAFDANKGDINCEDISLLIDYDLTDYGTYLEWKGDEVYPFYYSYKKQTIPSPFTKVLPANKGSIWLLGSDGGVANFQDSREEKYSPVFRRSDSAIASNIVPTATIDKKGNIWFGTIAGINKYDSTGGDFSDFPYLPDSTFDSSEVDTLEKYFDDLVSSIIVNKNISGIGEDVAGLNLVKEDFIWSSATDKRGKLWFGTLGGGIRVLSNDKEIKNFHLTKGKGLISNKILSIAVDNDNNIWLGTEQGVSKFKVQSLKFKVQNFSTLDGLKSGIIWDITPDDNGNIWFATQGGIFRYNRE